MFFHIDESGNTGNNLFDRAQPRLSYGLLSSRKNVDVLGVKYFKEICKLLGTTSLHANELGVGKLTKIVPQLSRLHNKMGFHFDFYYIDKKTFALVAFILRRFLIKALIRPLNWIGIGHHYDSPLCLIY